MRRGDGRDLFVRHLAMQSIRTDDEAAGQIGDIYVGHDAIRITQTLGDDVAWNGRLRLFRQHLPGIDGFLALGMVSRDAGQRSGVPHGNDIRGGSIGMRQRTEMVGAGIADIDHIGLVREVLIIGVTEQSSAAGAGGIRMILGQYQTGAGCAGHAAKAVSQIENVVLARAKVSSIS